MREFISRYARFALILAIVPLLIFGVIGMRDQAQAATASKSDLVVATAAAPLPASVDLSQWAPKPGYQGQVGACVPWTIAHAIMEWYANKMGTPTSFAPMYIYSQTHVDSSYDGGGSYVSDAMTLINQQGVDTVNDYMPQGDFDFTDKPTAAQSTNAATYKMQPATGLFGSNVYSPVTKQVAIETALANGTPVGVMFPLYDSFYSLTAKNSTMTNAMAMGTANGWHYSAVFGYDATGVIIENSWGSSWGDAGWAHLSWDFIEAQAAEAEAYSGFIASSLPSVPTPVVSTPATNTPVPVVSSPTTITKPTVPVQVSKAVVKLHVAKRTSKSVSIAWQAPAANVKSKPLMYWVVLTSKKYGSHQYRLSPKHLSLSVSKLHRNTTYTFRVQVVNAKGLSPKSASVKATTKR